MLHNPPSYCGLRSDLFNVCNDFFDDGGVVDTADDIDNFFDVGDVVNNVGVTFDGRVDVDPIDDGDVNDEVDTAMFPRPRCGNTVFSSVKDKIGCSVDLPA